MHKILAFLVGGGKNRAEHDLRLRGFLVSDMVDMARDSVDLLDKMELRFLKGLNEAKKIGKGKGFLKDGVEWVDPADKEHEKENSVRAEFVLEIRRLLREKDKTIEDLQRQLAELQKK